MNETHANASLDTELHQLSIYNEMRQRNQMTEMYRHVFNVLGSIISCCGIVGNLVSLIILLKPNTTTIITSSSSYKHNKASDTAHHIKRRATLNGTFDYKLTSFYSYLTALSVCDLFSCVFSVLNILEHIQPPYLSQSSLKFREICLYISIYTHPFAITLQSLSVWIICAFSMHRCRSIIKPSSFLKSAMRPTDSNSNHAFSFMKRSLCFIQTNANKRKYFFQMKLHNNCTNKNTELRFYTQYLTCCFNSYVKCMFCFCSIRQTTAQSLNSRNKSYVLSHQISPSLSDLDLNTNNSSEIRIADLTSVTFGEARRFNSSPKASLAMPFLNKLNKARLNILLLYAMAFVYLLPQLFEKRIAFVEIEKKTYVFPELTEFGRSKLYRQLFHLWFYLLSVYLVPFVLIFTFNFILLRAFLSSKKRCRRYIVKKEQNDAILRENRSLSAQNIDLDINDNNNTSTKPSVSLAVKSNNLTVVSSHSLNPPTNLSSISVETTREISTSKSVTLLAAETNEQPQQKQHLHPLTLPPAPHQSQHKLPEIVRSNTFRRKSNSFKMTNRSRSLTLTLFGVVFVFAICHLPAAIAKVVYVFYPKYEFELNNKNLLVSLWADFANFLIMLNSSINFMLYIVFGPGRFREEFKFMFEGMFRNVFQFLNENLFVYFKLPSKNRNNNSENTSNGVNRLRKNDEETSNACLRSSLDASNNAISIGSSNSNSRLKIYEAKTNETTDRAHTVILITSELEENV